MLELNRMSELGDQRSRDPGARFASAGQDRRPRCRAERPVLRVEPSRASLPRVWPVRRE